MSSKLNILILSVVLFYSKLCVCFVQSKDYTVNSYVLHDIADVFLFRENIKFKVYADQFWIKSNLLDIFVSKNGHHFSYKLIWFQRQKNYIFNSAFLFLDSLTSFSGLLMTSSFFRHQNEAVKFFIIIKNLKMSDLNSFIFKNKNMKLGIYSKSILIYSHFLVTDAEKITLLSVEWFGPKKCNLIQLKTLNIFSKKSMKWNKKLRNHEKFLNFHGCELTLMLPVPNKELVESRMKSIYPAVFEIASKKYNFKQSFQPVISKDERMLYQRSENIELVPVNQQTKMPNVYFELTDLKRYSFEFRVSNSIMDLQYAILVTPGELYSPYEKLLLPFDAETWILILVTFFATFITIFITNRMPDKIKNLIYGKKIRTPVWNVVGLIFGIGQTRLPDKSFARFILLLFIWFCLIFQTCFQSKMFENLTSKPRRPSPETIRGLIECNYTTFSFSREAIFASGIDQAG